MTEQCPKCGCDLAYLSGSKASEVGGIVHTAERCLERQLATAQAENKQLHGLLRKAVAVMREGAEALQEITP